MKDQTCQEAGNTTARPLEGWLDNGWPGKGVFPHTVAYGSGTCILAGGFGGGTGDGGGTCVNHMRHVRWRHERRRRAFAARLALQLHRVCPRSARSVGEYR